ncbi:MAG: methylated-DNA--[protein]-cysteine S-methyltransferase [Methylobacter sp.]|nr:methylated-DNA--[protein]-cysteine S-methyltransferase [Methylobacter sp.]
MPFKIKWVESCSGVEEVLKIPTLAGKLILHSQQDGVVKADWEIGEDFDQSSDFSEHELNILQQLNMYWLNRDKSINIKLLKQGSNYRNQVWAELCNIPFGETITYSALARKIGSAARAVGNACRDNPYPLFIPCHRVVSVTGLGGYNGQTKGRYMAIKCKLLEFEAAGKI